jgi:hypothetical protein
MMSFMSAQRPDVLIAIIAIALHGSNIFSFFISYTYSLGRSKVVLKVSHKHNEPPI